MLLQVAFQSHVHTDNMEKSEKIDKWRMTNKAETQKSERQNYTTNKRRKITITGVNFILGVKTFCLLAI